MTMTKQDLIRKIQDLPEDAPLDHLDAEIEKIRLRLRIDRGIQQTERGETVSHEEIEKMIDGWLEE
jgi:predicted transcriptional regulator